MVAAGLAFRWLLGVGADEIPADAEAHWSWSHLPQSWRVFVALFVVVGLLYAVWQLYQWEAPRLSTVRRRWLAGLRMAVITLLAITALGPAISYTQQRTLQPVIAVLRDASQSMATADVTSSRIARAEQINRWFSAKDAPLLIAIEERGQLRVFDYAQSVTPVEPITKDDQSTTWPPVRALGTGTNLVRALSEATSERLLAAVVLFTDGQHTDRATGADELRQLARRSRTQGVPWLIVGLGDPRPPRNLEVAEIYADAQVWKDDPFELKTTLKSTGFAAVTVPLSLVEQQWDAAGERMVGERVVETRDIEMPESGSLSVSFSHTPTVAGRFTYVVKATPLDGESTTDDNQPLTPAEVKVLDDQARVLLIAGGPHWEYRFVSRLLEREKSINLSCWLQTLDPNRAQEGDTTIPHLPRTREELMQFDVVLLLDPDPRDFDDAWMQLLSEFVAEHAGGLMYMAGPTFTGRFLTDARTSHVSPLLPVRLADVAATEVSRLLESPDREWPVAVVEAQLDHPVLRFDAAVEATREVWRTLPGIVWSYPITGPVPTARVLLEHSDPAVSQVSGPRPLLVAGHYGAGRTLFAGFEGTWRWRQVGRNAEFFNRFWVQVARFLIEGRAVEGQRRGVVETDRKRYEIGDRITVAARLNDARYQPLDEPEVTARWTAAGRESQLVTMRAVANQPGRYEAAVSADALGRNVMHVELPDRTEGSPTVEATFSVTPPSSERQRIWQDEPLLRDLAAESGGWYFTVDGIAALPAAIPDRQQTLVIQGKPQPIWDTSRWLLLIVGLLTIEWALRKRSKLL